MSQRLWNHRTNRGRIVYNTKKHGFTIKSVGNIAVSLVNNLPVMDKYNQSIPINYLFEVVRNGLYPYYLDLIRPWNYTIQTDWYWKHVEPKLRQAWMDVTKEICAAIADELGIPDYIKNFVLNNLFGVIWDTIWKLTDPLFKGIPAGRASRESFEEYKGG